MKTAVSLFLSLLEPGWVTESRCRHHQAPVCRADQGLWPSKAALPKASSAEGSWQSWGSEHSGFQPISSTYQQSECPQAVTTSQPQFPHPYIKVTPTLCTENAGMCMAKAQNYFKLKFSFIPFPLTNAINLWKIVTVLMAIHVDFIS